MFELRENYQGRPVRPQPLTDAEFERLSGVLGSFDNKRPMNLEQLDGFLAPLICGPELVPPSQYLPVIWGDNMVIQDPFQTQSVLQDFPSLVMRHSNVIADTLHSGELFLPLLLEDDSGVTHANDWAIGFLRGLEFHREQWAALLADEEHGGWLVPIFALATEHSPDPAMRPYKEPISTETREQLIVGAAAGVTGIYRYFQEQRLVERQPFDTATTFRRTVPKIGRNDPFQSRKERRHVSRSDRAFLRP
jgi:uncharacterized protein